ALFAVVQGAQYEDLRRHAVRGLLEIGAGSEDGPGAGSGAGMDRGAVGSSGALAGRGCDAGGGGFDGFGIGGALEKHNLAAIVRWVCEELPENKPRHLLGISEPDDLFAAIEAGADTFDCVSPSRV